MKHVYVIAGKTTLIQALTGDANLHPRDQLFATLDVTAHGGLLPCRLPVIYVDTIGFLSQLPHNLIESFSATLEDVVHSVSFLPIDQCFSMWFSDPLHVAVQLLAAQYTIMHYGP